MKKLLIVSSDDIILYQPTILNLYDYLKNDFDITIISFEPGYLGKTKDETRNIIYISASNPAQKIFRATDLVWNAIAKRIDKYIFRFSYRSRLTRKYKCTLLIKELQKHTADKVIAVDTMPLFAVQQVFRSSDLLSLEIIPGDSFIKKIDTKKINAVIIQNQARYHFLFGDVALKTFYIQNATFCENIYYNSTERKGLVWGGSIVKEFGVMYCIEFVKKYTQFQLTLKGAAETRTSKTIYDEYKQLLHDGHLIINEEYLSVKDFIKYLTGFKIGFCFYDWELIKRNFNYQTAPSGKVFMYLAAGVPVIACNIPGFKFLEENNAGILVDDYEPATILKAVQKIEANLVQFQQNCYRLFSNMCFDKQAEYYRDHILSDQN